MKNPFCLPEYIEDLKKFFEKEKHLLTDTDYHLWSKTVYDNLKLKFHDFILRLEEESVETKEAFKLIAQSAFEDKELSKEEKEEIGNQMKDVLKTVGLIGMAALPGGSLFFILAKFMKINKYILPSSFLNK